MLLFAKIGVGQLVIRANNMTPNKPIFRQVLLKMTFLN